MGDLIGEVVSGTLYFIDKPEFDRILGSGLPRVTISRLYSDFARINTLYMIAKAGSGHIGSSFSTMDIATWLHLNEMQRSGNDPDIYFSSKGHDAPGLYALLTALGVQEFDLIHKFRRLDGLPGHPDCRVEGLVTNTGSLGMGVSKAKGMAKAFNANNQSDRKIYVVLGDGELQEGQVWESLVSAANHNLSNIIAVVDHNKLQSDTFVADTSDLGDLDAKFASFGWAVERIDGHDLEALSSVLEKWDLGEKRPKLLIADTVKGRGISFMEHTAMESDAELYRFHSGAPDEDAYTQGVQEIITRVNGLLDKNGLTQLSLETVESSQPATTAVEVNMERLVPEYGSLLLEAATDHQDIVVLDADLALDTGILPFKDKFSDRFVECGIAEMDMVSQAGGMALQGLKPICHSFACFLSTRANEQIYNNATEFTKVGYVGALAGILPAAPGHSHQSVRDISAVGGCPNLIMIEPASAADLKVLFPLLVDATHESVYLRMTSIPWERPYETTPPNVLKIGQGYKLVEGKEAVLFAYGPVMCAQAVHAARSIKETSGQSISVINLPFLNRIDEDWLRDICSETKAIFTLDNHYINGGQGEKILSSAVSGGWSGTCHQFGLKDIPPGGAADEVLKRVGLDVQTLANTMIAKLNG